jgi:hypothetical protein
MRGIILENNLQMARISELPEKLGRRVLEMHCPTMDPTPWAKAPAAGAFFAIGAACAESSDSRVRAVGRHFLIPVAALP